MAWPVEPTRGNTTPTTSKRQPTGRGGGITAVTGRSDAGGGTVPVGPARGTKRRGYRAVPTTATDSDHPRVSFTLLAQSGQLQDRTTGERHFRDHRLSETTAQPTPQASCSTNQHRPAPGGELPDIKVAVILQEGAGDRQQPEIEHRIQRELADRWPFW